MAKVTTNLFCIQMLSICPFFCFFSFIFQTTLDKNCGKSQKFPLPPIISVVLGHAVQGAWRQQLWNWGEGFFFRIRLYNVEKLFLLKYSVQVCSLPASFSAWSLKTNISAVIFYYLTKFQCLFAFTSRDIGQYVYCNCLLTRLWSQKFWN